jgi:hypothetical protein
MTRDERYLANLRAGGVIILDEQVSIQQGRLQCVYFAEHPGATINDAAAAFLLTNWIGLPYREHGAQVVVRSALDAYCPQYAEGSVQ